MRAREWLELALHARRGFVEASDTEHLLVIASDEIQRLWDQRFHLQTDLQLAVNSIEKMFMLLPPDAFIDDRPPSDDDLALARRIAKEHGLLNVNESTP